MLGYVCSPLGAPEHQRHTHIGRNQLCTRHLPDRLTAGQSIKQVVCFCLAMCALHSLHLSTSNTSDTHILDAIKCAQDICQTGSLPESMPDSWVFWLLFSTSFWWRNYGTRYQVGSFFLCYCGEREPAPPNRGSVHLPFYPRRVE